MASSDQTQSSRFSALPLEEILYLFQHSLHKGKFIGDKINLAFWDWDVEAGTMDWDEAMEELLGIHPREADFLSELMKNVVYSDDQQHIKEAFSRLTHTAQNLRTQFRVNTKKRGPKLIRCVAKGFFEGQKLRRVVGFVYDVTEEERIKDEKLRYLDFLNSLPDGVVLLDSRYKIQVWNKGAERLFGYSHEETTGQSFFFNTQQDYLKQEEQWLKTSDGESEKLLTGKLSKSGKTHFVQLFKRLLRSAHGELEGYGIFVQDQTELINAKQQSEENALVLRSFISDLSEEIKIPLEQVLSLALSLQNNKQDFSQKEKAGTIHETIDSLLVVLNKVIDFSQIGSEEFHSEKKPFVFKSIVNTLDNLYSDRAREKGLALVFELDKRLPYLLRGDRTRYLEILSNILSNAIKFSEKGVVRTNIVVEDESQDKILVRNTIKDVGPGIATEDHGRIFKSFVQLGSLEKDGAGLGLPFASKLTEILGGHIDLESAPGKGATFHVYLPFEKPELTNEPSLRKKQEQKIKPRKILVAEDNHHNRILLEKILNRFGQYPVMVKDGIEALEVAGKHKFELMILDIEMPELNGYETLRKFREKPGYRNTPIWSLTAHSLNDHVRRSREAGFNDCLTKPLNPKILGKKLNELFDIPKDPPAKIKPAQEGQGTPQFDLSLLNELGGNDKAFIDEMLNTFLEDVPEYLEMLQGALKEKHIENIQFFTHKLKSPLNLLGYNKVEEEFDYVEDYTKLENKDFTTLNSTVQNVMAHSGKLLKSIQSYKKAER